MLGFREAIRNAGMQEIVEIPDPESQDSIDKLIKRHKPDVFVCANDRTAGQLMVRLNEQGIEIPSL